MNSKIKKKHILDLSGVSKLRIKKGYTQKDLSLMTEIPEKRIRQIERGFVNTTMIEVIKITEALGLDLKLSVINKFHEPEELIKRAIQTHTKLINDRRKL